MPGGGGGPVVRPLDGTGNPADTPRDDLLADRMWGILTDSRTAHVGSLDSIDNGNAHLGNPLDSLTCEEASPRGGQTFTYKGITFAVRRGVLHWLTECGQWVPVTTAPFGDCHCCAWQAGFGEAVRHWHSSSSVRTGLGSIVRHVAGHGGVGRAFAEM